MTDTRPEGAFPPMETVRLPDPTPEDLADILTRAGLDPVLIRPERSA